MLVVTRLDRLGRNAIDVAETVAKSEAMGVGAHWPCAWRRRSDQRGGQDDNEFIATVAQFERDLLIERTKAGLAGAKAEGKALGPPGVPDAMLSVQACASGWGLVPALQHWRENWAGRG